MNFKLTQFTSLVADTADFFWLKELKSQDVTTNPSLVLKALSKPEYLDNLQSSGERASDLSDLLAFPSISGISDAVDHLLVRLGALLLRYIPGRVSAEVDPRLSFDTQATIQRARHLVALFKAVGVDSKRVLIKIAATWEGIQAAKQLELEGVSTNLTLVFCFAQAVACAQAKVQLISPFVGRIYDWHKKAAGPAWDEAANSGLNDPGVKSVHAIYNHFKHFDIPTEIMGASFRNLGQILALSGCDLLTISPELLQQLAEYEQSLEAQAASALPGDHPAVPRVPVSVTFPELSVQAAKAMDLQPVEFDEAAFRWALNEDAMATEKLAEGIRAFAADTRKLEALIQAH
jgi:transaldolase